MASDRMFQVLVVGGMALVGAACGPQVVVGTGGAAGSTASAGGTGGAGGAGGATGSTEVASSGFPQETGFIDPDAGTSSSSSSGNPCCATGCGDAGFPCEGPPP